MRRLLLICLLLALPAPASARDPLGVFGGWGVFRDAAPRRCYAIAEPDEQHDERDRRPFATFSNWPERGVRMQFHARLRLNRLPGSRAMLTVGSETFPLVAGPADVWAPDAASDGRIVRAVRQSEWMRVTARSTGGRIFSDVYALRGAATAIDATLIGCARRR